MEYEGIVRKLLESAGADVGDTVEFSRGDERYKGIVMPHFSFSGRNILTLKLENGYNVGFEVRDDCTITLISKKEEVSPAAEEKAFDESKPTVAILGTGGTIASYVEYRTGAVHPAEKARDLVFSVPELSDICNVRAKVLYSIFSEDMKVEYWQELAREVAKELNSGSKGVIVPHGTDTLGYTSAALSFMLDDLSGPVILIGSQRSSDRPSSDAFINLTSAARLASTDIGEVVAVMHGEPSDKFCLIHRGTKMRKMHTSRRDAFRSINQHPLGLIYEDGTIEFKEDYSKAKKGEVKVKEKMEDEVCLVYFYPGLSPEDFRRITMNKKGVVIAGTGLGHVSTSFIPSVRELTKNGIPVVMTSQCLSGRVNMNVYETGRELLRAGAIPGEDMLPETAYVKLMWVLGQTEELSDVRKMMMTNLRGEINPAIVIDQFGE